MSSETKELNSSNRRRRISSNGDFEGVNDANDNWMLPNNAVAQSDIDVALETIQEIFQEALQETEDKGLTDPEMFRLFMQDTKESLTKNLKRVVQPVEDRKFQDFVDLYHVVTEDDDDIVEEEKDGTHAAQLEELNDDREDEKEELDKADLVDKSSLQEAKDKRARVRSLSKSIQKTREEVLQGSLEALMKKQQILALQALTEDRTAAEWDEAAAQQEELNDALQKLCGVLQDSSWDELPQQLDSLQSTIDVILKESDKDRPMSQIEAAIVSRTNSAEDDDQLDWDELLSQGSDDNENTKDIAERGVDRLARFFEIVD